MSKMGAYLTIYNYSLRNPFGSVFTINNLKPIINPKEYKSRKGNIIQTNQGPEGAGIRRVIANWRKMDLEFHEQEVKNVSLILVKFLWT